MKKRKSKSLKLSPFSLLLLIIAAFGAGYTANWFVTQLNNPPQNQRPLNSPLYLKDGLKDRAPEPEKIRPIIHANCLIGCPSGTPIDNIFVDHDVMVLSSNIKSKFADWVAYKVTPNDIAGPARTRNWHKDPKIDVQFTFTPSDYKGMSLEPYFFDRGHQAPLASFKNHPKWYTLNYLSNITPQKKDLNRGAWKALESAERKLVHQYGTTYILTGPYYDKNDIVQGPPIQRMNYIIPSGYWKIIAIKNGDTIKATSFMFPQNTPPRDSHCKHIATVPEIQHMTGLVFFDGKVPVADPSLKTELGCGIKENINQHG